MRLSVLDQSPVSEGGTGAGALANTLDLARAADALGYHRYWLAEHHGGAMLAGPSPEALIGPVAAATSHLRVGSGGVMLPHYSPFKVAETFSVLAALYPGRIDLGLGRAAGTDPLTTFALQADRRHAATDHFPEQLAELLGYLRGQMPAEHPFQRLQSGLPGGDELPEPWLLGSSSQSTSWAVQLELPYAFADFINPGAAQIRLAKQPEAVAVWALAAESDEEARHLASSSRMALHEVRRGNPIAVPPPEKAVDYLRAIPRHHQAGGRRAVVGTPAKVRAGLEEVAAAYGADEVIVVTITHDHAARRRSYELIAEAFELEAPHEATVTKLLQAPDLQ